MSGCENFNFKGSISRLKLLEEKLVNLRNHYKREESIKYRTEKIDFLNQYLDVVKNNIDDANIFRSLCELIRDKDIKLDMCSSKIKNLTNENTWLHEELKEARERLYNAEMQLIDEQEKVKHLEFLNSEPCTLTPVNSQPVVLSSTPSNVEGPALELKRIDNTDSVKEPTARPDVVEQSSKISDISTYKFGTLKTLDDLVSKYSAEKRYELSITLCKEAIEEIKSLNPKHPDIASVYILLSSAYREQGNFNDAKYYLCECLKLREAHYGEEHPIIASTCNNLSVLYGKSKKFMQAEILCRRALLIRQKIFGESHPDVAKQLVNLAVLNQSQGKLAEAEACYTKAINIYTACFNHDDPNISKIKSKLATVLIKASKYTEAEAMIKDMIVESFNSVVSAKLDVSQPQDYDSSLEHAVLDSSRTFSEFGDWHKTACSTSPSLMHHVRNLVLLYKNSGNIEKTQEVNRIAKDLTMIRSLSELRSIIAKLGVELKD